MNIGNQRLGQSPAHGVRNMNNEDFEEPGSSARIEHIDVDGDLDIEIDDFGVRKGPNQYQVDH